MLKRFIFYWLPVYLYMGVIFYFSSQKDVPVPSLFPGSDKLLHVAEYCVLGVLLIRALCREYPQKSFTMLTYAALIIAAGYGVSDEFHQGFVSGRSVDFFDWCADSLGAALGACVIFRPLKESRT